jgi:hypothetical protein
MLFSDKNIQGPANATLKEIHAYAKGIIQSFYLSIITKLLSLFRKYRKSKQSWDSANVTKQTSNLERNFI